MIVLTCHDAAAWLGALDLATGEVEAFRNHERPNALRGAPSLGWYSHLDGTLLAALYRDADRLWMSLDGVVRAVQSAASVDWVGQASGMTRLSLVEGDQVVASVVYFGGDTSGVPPEWDFITAGAEPEHFDFGRFVQRILADPPRIERMFGAGLTFDPSQSVPTDDDVPPHRPAAEGPAAAALAALPDPVRAVDLGPLAGVRPEDYRRSPGPSEFDDALRAFLDETERAPKASAAAPPEPGAAPPQQFAHGPALSAIDPPVAPLALGLRDTEREVLQVFAERAAARASATGDPSSLQTAVVATVIGGLDCLALSPTFNGARQALDAVGDAAAQLALDLGALLEDAAPRVGFMGSVRLGAWHAARQRR